MAFFVRYKKVKKSPGQQSKDRKQPTNSKSTPPNQSSQTWQPGSPLQQALPFQPAGLLTAPPRWSGGGPAPLPYHQSGPLPPIIVNQNHYYLGPPPPPPYLSDAPAVQPQPSGSFNLGTAVDLAKDLCQGLPQVLDDICPVWQNYGAQLVRQGNQLVDEISHQFDNVLTAIDSGAFNGRENDIYTWQPEDSLVPSSSAVVAVEAKKKSHHSKSGKKSHKRDAPKSKTSTSGGGVGFFGKVELYANSKLPMDLPPLKLYIPTYPLICLAAQYSERVYEPPSSREERDCHVGASLFSGTKAMVIKSVPMDYMNTIVFAIRGTATFMDWAVNLDTTPTAPTGFLDDPTNLCHSGFLSVARNTIGPVAKRLRQFLEEDPRRASHSLLITGHSAGGAVAALLYAHMLASSPEAESELTAVAGCFKRVHCITFGAPPVSVKPLTKPTDEATLSRRPQLRKSVFLSFVNEGDPVTRADKGYVKSLLELYAAPAPKPASVEKSIEGKKAHKQRGSTQKSPRSSSSSTAVTNPARPTWPVPDCSLSLAGRVVVLRSGADMTKGAAAPRKKNKTIEERLKEGVVAQVATDAQLRGVVWGDPVAHMMRLYLGRVEVLAVGAVTGRNS